ncbi:MAG: hypothetical protein PVF17_04685, partial [Ignavibacteria bacterium]
MKIDKIGLAGLIIGVIGLITTYPFWQSVIKTDYDVKLIPIENKSKKEAILSITNNKDDVYLKEIIILDKNIENISTKDTTHRNDVVCTNTDAFNSLKYRRPILWKQDNTLEFNLNHKDSLALTNFINNVRIRLSDDSIMLSINMQEYNHLRKLFIL